MCCRLGGIPAASRRDRSATAQDTESGQIKETHSISAGLDYPGVGPEHAWLKESGRADYVAVDDAQATLLSLIWQPSGPLDGRRGTLTPPRHVAGARGLQDDVQD